MKRALHICFVAIFLFLILPYLSLTYKSHRFTKAYRLASYMFLANTITREATSQDEVIQEIFAYTHRNLDAISGVKTIWVSPLHDLRRGIAWCDQQSNVFATLLAFKNIPAKYFYLFDDHGGSPHTMSLVNDGTEWQLMGPMNGLMFQKKAQNLTLEDIQNHPRLILYKKYFPEKYKQTLQWYQTFIPLRKESLKHLHEGLTAYDINIKDTNKHMICLTLKYFMFLFGDHFLHFFQDHWLHHKVRTLTPQEYQLDQVTPDFITYFKARNYHLYNRYEKAKPLYEKMIQDYPQSRYTDDALFFLGKLYLKTDHLQKAIEVFQDLEKTYPNSGWLITAHFFKGTAYEKMNNYENALNEYYQSAFELQTPALEAYHRLLNQVKLTKIQTTSQQN